MFYERRIFAHRGMNHLAPENTLAAIRSCADYGVTWFETDVDILGDGTAIVCHDTTLDRTTNKSGSYYDLTANDLVGIDAGSWFGPKFVNEPLPTLSALVELMNELELNANIELKSNEAGAKMSRQLIDSVISELSNLDEGREIIVSSFNHVLLAEFKRQAPQYQVGCLYETCALYPDWRSLLELVGADFIHPEDSGLTRDRVEVFKAAGFGVNVWTVNDPGRANELFNWGVNGIFTDVAHTMPKN